MRKHIIKGSMNRREIISLLGAGGAVSLAGCTEADEPEQDEGATNPETDGEMGGTLRVSTTGQQEDLNPLTHTSYTEYIATQLLYSNLTQVNSDLSLRGDLAHDWESIDGGEAWIFHLKDYATWTNGDSVTASDVKATLDAIEDEDYLSDARGELGPIDNVEVLDSTTVQINLSSPYGDIPRKMAEVNARIIPESVVEAGPESDAYLGLSNEPQGSGAFTLEEFTPADRLVFAARDDYWKEGEDGNQLPYVDEVIHVTQPETSTRINSLRDESIDHMFQVPPDQFDQVESMSGVTSGEMEGAWFYPVMMDADTEPFDDVRVRQAVKYAVDKEEMLLSAAGGRGTIAQHTPISPAHTYYADLDDRFGVNAEIEEAQALMDEAGYSDGYELDEPLLVSPDHGGPMGPTAVLLQEQLREIGIEFEIENMPWTDFLGVYDDAPMYVTSYGMRLVDDGILTLVYMSDGPWNNYNWANEEFDEALENAMRSVDEEETQEHYTRAQEIIQEDCPQVIPFFMDRLDGYQDYVQGYEMEPTAFRYNAEDVWLQE